MMTPLNGNFTTPWAASTDRVACGCYMEQRTVAVNFMGTYEYRMAHCPTHAAGPAALEILRGWLKWLDPDATEAVPLWVREEPSYWMARNLLASLEKSATA